MTKGYIGTFGGRYVRHGENQCDAEGVQRLVGWEDEL